MAIQALKSRIAEYVSKTAKFRAEEVSGALAMNQSWIAVVQSELRSWIHANVFNFRNKKLLAGPMSASALSGDVWEALARESLAIMTARADAQGAASAGVQPVLAARWLI